ncbi:MAG: alkaline phosphatase [Alphaproteobacteria bacterium]|nr:MAG: alkaline phosphatase [Alphaproteobacteria bacterium]
MAIESRLEEQTKTNIAKNVILFIGDGMGVSTVTAARILDGQSKGGYGEENILPFETFPNLALVKTYNTNQQVPDSAGTASSMNTGVKTRAGVLGISSEAHRKNCKEALRHTVPTLGELAKRQGKSLGIVTTARLTHATPAAVYAHTPERNWESEDELPADARAEGCRSIARQLVDFGNGIDVAFGGGRGKFSSALLERWKKHTFSSRLITDREGLMGLTSNDKDPVLGLFSMSHMTYMLDKTPDNTEPTLSEMTSKAIDLLSERREGFYLMVEGGRIDHGHHAGIAGLALTEAQEFSKAVQVALDKVDLSETLILVTADHSHVFTIAGYPTRGNPILGLAYGNDTTGDPSGKVLIALDGVPITALGYQNGPGAIGGRRTNPETGLRARQQALVPTGYHSGENPKKSETHAGEDVALYAIGPWAHLASGVMEQNVIFHIITHAYGWDAPYFE